MTDTLFRNVDVEGCRVDVAVSDEVITAVATQFDGVAARIIDGHGEALLPGLHDHHIHLYATAAQALSVQCGPPAVLSAADLVGVLAGAPGSDWVRGVGYVETVAGLLDSTTLDELCAHRPVRLQHRSGAMWILNTLAAQYVDLDAADYPGVERDDTGRATGRVWRADDWLRERLPPTPPPDLTALGKSLARLGITGVTDATPDLASGSLIGLVDAHVDGALPQRLQLLGVSLNDTPDLPPTVTVGAYKIVLADSGLPDYDDLVARIERAHQSGRPVAVHCVSRVALVLLMAALREVGAMRGDRIEHGAVIPAECIEELAKWGVAVVTQPGFIADRGDDYLQRVDAEDLPHLYRCRSLTDGGVLLGLSSDAPYGPVNPWEVIEAAMTRVAPGGTQVGGGEVISASAALGGYLTRLDDPGGTPRKVAVGEPADLVLVDGSVADPASITVRCTMIRGEVVWWAEG